MTEIVVITIRRQTIWDLHQDERGEGDQVDDDDDQDDGDVDD